MGKGFNNYMTKKFFHPSSKDNIKRKWMAEQKTAFEKKAQEDLLAQYQKEQEVLSNRALLGDEKAKVGLSFMYDPPPGLKKKEEAEGQQQEVKFEWQRKYNAPREAYAKDDDTIRDQPFGIEVRNVRCIKCRQWGHVNTDKICPLFSRNLTAEPEMPESSSTSILEGMQAEGFTIKNSVLGRIMGAEPDKHREILADEDDSDPEVKFLQSLTPKQKKKLLKKLNKLQSEPKKKKSKKSKKRKSSSDSSDEDSDVPKKKKKSQKQKRHDSSNDESDDSYSQSKHKSNREDKHSRGDVREDRQREERYREDRQREDRYKEDRHREDRHREDRHREDRHREDRHKNRDRSISKERSKDDSRHRDRSHDRSKDKKHRSRHDRD